MKVPAIIVSISLALAMTAAAQGAPGGKAESPGVSSKPKLEEIRSLVRELQGPTEKLRELMSQYRSILERRPQPEGGGPEAKKAYEEQVAKWNAALDRMLDRIDAAHASVVETKQRLDRSAKTELPTALAKDVVNAQNEAEAQRVEAEKALAKRKRQGAGKSKHAK